MSVDALQIWGQLAESAECREAVNYYSCKYGPHHQYGYTTDNKRKRAILERGAADFDQKYCASDEDEKAHYRTDYYVSGYMNMHLNQNLAAFRHCFKNDDIPQPLLLVDFGCGPMTSGLALAQILSEQSPDYKTHTAYFGIDASKNMVAKAQNINKEHNLFEHFEVVPGIQFDSQAIPHSFPPPKIIVLCFSYVLAPTTFRPDIGNEQEQQIAAYELAKDWKKYIETQQECKETRIIYLNPLLKYLHPNWHRFKFSMSQPNREDKFCYTADNGYTILADNCCEVYYYMIHGKR